jgi:hypothetical protein
MKSAVKRSNSEVPANLQRSMQPSLLFGLLLGLLLFCVVPQSILAAEVDLSCMSHNVVGKIQVAERYKEYDVGVRNSCPGPVYWAMCIERVDPLTHAIVEVHNPSGYLDAEQKSRVNLQMKKGPERMVFRKRFQEFYVSVGYAIDAAARASCVAASCEAEHGDLRKRLDANVRAWEAAEKTLAQQLASACPQSGWGKTEEVEPCEAGIREAAQENLARFAQSDAELRRQLQEEGLQRCRVHGGDLVP